MSSIDTDDEPPLRAGTPLICSAGSAPSVLSIPSGKGAAPSLDVLAGPDDHVPMLNILPFGVCTSPANPMVAAATAAAHGRLTPMPCRPLTVTPWVAAGVSADAPLPIHAHCHCNWGGIIGAIGLRR